MRSLPRLAGTRRPVDGVPQATRYASRPMRADTDFEALVTDRLVLRRSRPEDADPISGYRSDPEVHRQQGWERTDPEGVRADIEEMAGRAPRTGASSGLLWRAGDEESAHRGRALQQAARAARYWNEEARDLAEAGRSLTELH